MKNPPKRTFLAHGSVDSYGIGTKLEHTLDLVAGLCIRLNVDPEVLLIEGNTYRKRIRKEERITVDTHKKKEAEKLRKKELDLAKRQLQIIEDDLTPLFPQINGILHSSWKTQLETSFGRRYTPIELLRIKFTNFPIGHYDPDKDRAKFNADLYKRLNLYSFWIWLNDDKSSATDRIDVSLRWNPK